MNKRLIIIAFGTLVIYTISNIYLEKILFLENLTSKTVFSFVYFLAWISPLLYLWKKGEIPERYIALLLVLFLGIFYTSVLVTSPVPIGRYTPDVAFHGAKVLYCSTGHFFNDPATSFPSIYPPVYHIILGSIMSVTGFDNNWYLINLFHVLMLIVLFLSVYILASSLFNPRAGLLSVLFFGAVIDMPIESGIFFPTPFMLGLTVIINSVTLVYLALKGRRWCFCPAGLFTGLAVTIWPAFLPLALILAIIIFFNIEKELRRLLHLLKFSLPFLILPLAVWIPQYLLLNRYHLLGHHSIGQYKGIPGLSWFFDFAVKFIFLGGFADSYKWVSALFGLIYVILIIFAIMGFRSLESKHPLPKRFLKLFFILMLVTLPLLHYVFTYMYSRRFQVLFSTLIVIVASFYLVVKLNSRYRILGLAFIVCAVGFSGSWNFYKAHEYVLENKKAYEIVKKYTSKVLEFFESNTSSGDYMFATARTYRDVIFGNLIRFNLVVHREGNYYSLNPKISEIMLSHYNAILFSDDFSLIKKTLEFYKIRYILIHKKDPPVYPGLRVLMENCKPAYKDEWFTVLELE